MQKENATIQSKAKIAPIYYHGPRTAKKVALTFDDGPDQKYTSQVLDVLKQNKVKGTFFVVGTMAETKNTKRISTGLSMKDMSSRIILGVIKIYPRFLQLHFMLN